MRYSPEHKIQIREKLIASSGALAKRGGFASTGVDALMKAVGLTGGAFYSHFASKDELFSAIIERELSQSMGRMTCVSDDKLQRCLQAYLTLAHVENIDGGCPLPSLGAEIARNGEAARDQAEQWLLRWHQAWSHVLESEELAWAYISQCVGALLMARLLNAPQRQQQVLDGSLRLLQPPLSRDVKPV
jgi:TetR/AcrR family transcriptional repressor of nem operon